jgi:hypothetical protein
MSSEMEDMKIKEIELVFTKEGMLERIKVEGAYSGQDWHERDVSYQDLAGRNDIKLTVDKIDPVIENGNLQSLRFHVTDYTITQKIKKGIRPDSRNEKLNDGIKINGQFFRCKKQYEILLNTANWLIVRGDITNDEVPIEAEGRPYSKPYLINSVPYHILENGERKKFGMPKTLKNGLYIETKYAFKDTIRHAKRLMQHCGGYPESDLQVIGFENRVTRRRCGG